MIVEQNISLKQYNTFDIEATAERFAAVASVEDIFEVLEAVNKQKSDLMILGGGSNILLTRDVQGLVLKNDLPGVEVIREDEEHVYVRSGAGVNWHQFVLYCLDNDYAGVENLALIPGNVGASPMQNIGAYGVELKDVFHSLEAVHTKDKALAMFLKEDCQFGYRESIFKGKHKNEFVIASVTFALLKKPNFQTSYGAIRQELDAMQKDTSIQSIAEAVMRIRRSKLPDPNEIGNAGSFFKNPTISEEHFQRLKKVYPGIVGYGSETGYKMAAGWMIEQCGWKGYRKGDAGCHERQALVLVNHGSASGSEILDLSLEIIASVDKKFGVILEREVNIF